MQKRNKYGNQKYSYNGTILDSKGEAKFAFQLDMRIKAGDKISYETDVKLDFVFEGKKMFTYKPDFVITDLVTNQKQYIDIKGFNAKTKKFITTSTFMLKKKLIEAQHKITIELVKA